MPAAPNSLAVSSIRRMSDPGPAALSRHRHGLDDAAPVKDPVENAELGFGGQVADVGHFEAIAEVGLVAAVAGHGVVVGKISEGSVDLELRGQIAHQAGVKTLDEVEHVGFVDEAHFKVELGEFGLAVGAQVPRPGSSGRSGNSARRR